MKWKNLQKDEPPQPSQEVLISVNGIYYIAIFDKDINHFLVKNQQNLRFSVADHLIYWTEIGNLSDNKP